MNEARISAELKALVGCLRYYLNKDREGSIIEQQLSVADWERVLTKAQEHGVVQILHKVITENFPHVLTEEARAELDEVAKKCAFRNLYLTKEMLKITELFAGQGIKSIALKGAALAQDIYGDSSLRDFKDIDILVPVESVTQARTVLKDVGYTPQFEYPSGFEDQCLKSTYFINFYRQDGNSSFDLHWDLLEPHYSFKPDRESLFASARQIQVWERPVLALSRENLFRFLIIHGTKHMWSRLNWILDIAALVSSRDALDWKRVLLSARNEGASRMTALGLFLAKDILAVDVPEKVEAFLKEQPEAVEIAQSVYDFICANDEFAKSGLSAQMTYLRTMDRLGDRAAHIRHVIFTPTPNEWNALKLPKPLMPLYYPFRPLRLGLKYALSGLRRLVT